MFQVVGWYWIINMQTTVVVVCIVSSYMERITVEGTVIEK